MKIEIYHNIRWSRYKAAVFSAVYRLAPQMAVEPAFVQIADTSGQREGLSTVDLSYHQYPHTLMFPGSYDAVPRPAMAIALFRRVWISHADIVLLPGYDRVEYWAMILAALLRRKRRGVFCDSTLFDRPQSQIKGLFKRLFFKICDGYFGYGVRSRELLLRYGADATKIFHRCQAAALPHSYTVERARRARCECTRPVDEPSFLYVGRLSKEKSLDVLILAFANLRNRYPKATLVIVGSGPDESSLRATCASMGVATWVKFAGSMDQVGLATQYAAATCLVLPSVSEPWGLVVNEALHYGCPVVVSDRCGCVPELVSDEAHGLVFAAGDPQRLSEALQQAVERFSNREITADRCLQAIAAYTPDAAALQIIDGCNRMNVRLGR